jgi:lipopolysaccharide export system protein LptC
VKQEQHQKQLSRITTATATVEANTIDAVNDQPITVPAATVVTTVKT